MFDRETEGRYMTQHTCSCSCGTVSYTVSGTPRFRIYCHCTICQRFNDAAFADVVVYDASSVGDPPEGSVVFDTYKPPPNVKRGKCSSCGDPALEVFEAPLFPKLRIVPASMFASDAALPDSCAHIFYDKRLEDASDELPKHSGMIASQLSFGKYLFRKRKAG